MDLGEEARSRKAFRDRANQTADAEALRGMGDDSPGFCGHDVTERGTDGVFARRQLSERRGSVPRSDTRPSREQDESMLES